MNGKRCSGLTHQRRSNGNPDAPRRRLHRWIIRNFATKVAGPQSDGNNMRERCITAQVEFLRRVSPILMCAGRIIAMTAAMLAFDRAERSDVGSSMIVQLGLFNADLRICTRSDSRG